MTPNAGSATMVEPVARQLGNASVIIAGAIRLLRRTLGLLWLTSLATVVLLALATNLGPTFGLEVFAIRGGSMATTIPVGAAIITVRTDPEAVRVGDIVTIRADNGVVFTHRVVDIDASEADHWLRTKGDANATADAAPVPMTSVIGVVAATIPLVGYLIAMMAEPAGLVSFLAYLVALLLAIWELEAAERTADARRRHARAPNVARA